MGQLAYLPTTPSITNNYLFIEHSFPELYRLSQEVEKYYSIDHSCCLLKARLYVELWCHEVGGKLYLKPPVSGDLNSKIKQISMSKKVPTYIIDTLNNLRVEGNKSAHITQDFQGVWSCEYSISEYKLGNLMRSLLEITQYLAFKLNLQNETEQLDWKEPVKLALQEDITASLMGNKEATLSLAKHFAEKIKQAMHHNQISGKANKAKVQLLQHDLAYWIERANKQNHPEVWALFADVYMNKLLMPLSGETAESCFKKALQNDESGSVAYEYASYLLKNSQHKRSLTFMHQSAEKCNQKAIQYLQAYYYQKQPQKYLGFIEKGIENKVKQSFTLDFISKLTRWESEQDNEILKTQAKSALTNALSYQSDGAQYYKAYCEFVGYWGKTPNQNESLLSMIEHHKAVPAFIHYEDKLFNILQKHPEHIDLALELSSKSLYCCSEKDKPKMKFDIAMLLWQKLRENGKAKSPYSLKELIRESAKGECFEAKQFIKSPKGKALMRDNSVVCQINNKRTVSRKKQKVAKKHARKARR